MAHSDRNRRGAGGGIPPRWLHCPRKAVALIGEKFLAFKTPLGPQYDSEVPEECRFPPSMLLASMNSYKVKMGLWIDLTNTGRFYDKKEVDDRSVKHLKLQCRGHGECPNQDQTNSFVKICTNFISKNPLEIIGVHCTHGFNRSGFMIVAYLVENLNWSLEAAVAAFAQARPPGIYKEDYLLELFKRYGDGSDIPPTPPLPDWCKEYDDGIDDDGNMISNGNAIEPHNDVSRRRGKEYNKKNPTFMDGVPGVTIIEQPTLLQIQRKCQDMAEWEKTGFPGLQPISMDKDNIQLLRHKPYKVSWKADGTRYMMLIDGEDQVYFVDRDNCVFQVSNLRFPRRKEPHTHISGTLLDGEMVIDKVNGNAHPRYLVYDIVKFEGQEVGKADFDRRLLCIQKEIIQPRITAMEKGEIDKSVEPFSIRRKDFWDIACTKDLLSEKFTKQVGHEVDGLIFQPAVDAYTPGRNPEVLKWKPPSMNSVDFKLVISKENRQGMLPETKGHLYVGGFNYPIGEIKVTKDLKALDKKIIECKHENGKWLFMRERTDKSFPNSYDTAMGVCNSIRDPITKERLFEIIDSLRLDPKRPHGEPSHMAPPAKRMCK